MESYKRDTLSRPDNPQPNEIRITTQGRMRKYILYAVTLLEEKNLESIVLRAMGKTISKAVSIAEILKRRYPLHQITEIGSQEIEEVYKPTVEGLDEIKHTKRVSSIQITLSTAQLDTNALGYQAPIKSDQKGPQRPRPPFTGNRGGMMGQPGRGGFVNRRGGGGRGGMGPRGRGFSQPPMHQPPQQFQNNFDHDVRNQRFQGRPQQSFNQNQGGNFQNKGVYQGNNFNQNPNPRYQGNNPGFQNQSNVGPQGAQWNNQNQGGGYQNTYDDQQRGRRGGRGGRGRGGRGGFNPNFSNQNNQNSNFDEQ
jgi:DNA-binding protein Alba